MGDVTEICVAFASVAITGATVGGVFALIRIGDKVSYLEDEIRRCRHGALDGEHVRQSAREAFDVLVKAERRR